MINDKIDDIVKLVGLYKTTQIMQSGVNFYKK